MSLARKRITDTFESYKSNEINTASQGQLIVMMYDGAVRFIQNAIDNMTPNKYDVVNNNILRASDIVTELMLSLDMPKGGKVAEGLFSVYVYLKKRMLEANVAKDTKILKEVQKHLKELRTAWVEVAKTDEGKQSVSNTHAQGSSFNIEG